MTRRFRRWRETHRYRAVLVANGHHWDPRWPEPPLPGSEEFAGEQMHVHSYREPRCCAASGCWCWGSATRLLISRSSPRGSPTKTFLAMRRGAYILPKYLNGKPTDESASPLLTRLPLSVQRFFIGRMLGLTAGDMTVYGLPKPDHKLLEAHPTVSAELLSRLGHGDIAGEAQHRPLHAAAARCASPTAARRRSTWSSTAPATRSPSRSSTPSWSRPRATACRSTGGSPRSSIPASTSSASIQPLGAIMPIAEAQAEWVADLLARAGSAALGGRDAGGDRGGRTEDEEALRRL